MLFCSSNVVSLPRDTVLHKLFQCWVLPMGCSSSRTAPVSVPSTGCSLSGTDRSSMDPRWCHRSCRKTWSCMGSPWGHSFLQGTSTFSRVVLCGLQRDSLLPHGVLLEMQQNLFSKTGSTSSPFFFANLGGSRAVPLTFSYTSLPAAVVLCFLPVLKCVITEVLPMSLTALASGRSVLELSGTSCV